MQTEFRKVYLSRKKNLKSHFWWISSPLCHTVISVLYYESVKNIPFINITYILKYTASTELLVCLLLIPSGQKLTCSAVTRLNLSVLSLMALRSTSCLG